MRNPKFTGNLIIDENNDVRRLFNDNYNSYSQLCLELFEYMEEILNLVQVIFSSLDQSRTNSMTATGQCRLNPLIACVQDSSLLYDYIVKVLFKLHEGNEKIALLFDRLMIQENIGLAGDTLQSHRLKLSDHFRRLKRFYSQTSTLQYFRNLIKVPILPEVQFDLTFDFPITASFYSKSPPNFNIKDDMKNYQSPVPIVTTSTTDDILIDTSDDVIYSLV